MKILLDYNSGDISVNGVTIIHWPGLESHEHKDTPDTPTTPAAIPPSVLKELAEMYSTDEIIRLHREGVL